MMLKFLSTVVLAASLTFGVLPASADEKADVKTLVDNAVAHIQKVGNEQAYKDFADSNGAYRPGGMYLVVQMASDGKMVAHAANPKLNGMAQYNMKDTDGKYFVREMIEALKSKEDGWIDYKWVNPANKKISQKHSYFKKIGEVVVLAGYYE